MERLIDSNNKLDKLAELFIEFPRVEYLSLIVTKLHLILKTDNCLSETEICKYKNLLVACLNVRYVLLDYSKPQDMRTAYLNWHDYVDEINTCLTWLSANNKCWT